MSQLQFKNSDELRLDVDQLIDFKERKKSVFCPAKIQEQDLRRSKLLSKYAQVLCCSFENGEPIEQEILKLP
jgi:hypothetical protein